jgi:sulfur-carrier protein
MPRTVTFLYFAGVREAVGRSDERRGLPDEVQTVADLAAWLEEVHPSLRGRLGTVRFAVNEAFASPDGALGDGDVIAVIPPVSGG